MNSDRDIAKANNEQEKLPTARTAILHQPTEANEAK